MRWQVAAAASLPRLCLTCDLKFHSIDDPAGFVILLPDRPDPHHVVCAPVCLRCCSRSDAAAMTAAEDAFRKAIWPGLRRIEVTGDGGRA